MKHLVYRSRLVDPRGARIVPDILRRTRARNAIHGITGVLVFDGESFCQHLEGTAAEVDRIFAKIGKDPRHDCVEILAQGPVRSRRYSVWSMAYGLASSHSLIDTLGATPAENVADELQNALPSCDLEV